MSTCAAAQIDFDAVAFTSTELGGSVDMLQGAGGNLALLDTPDGALLVDADFGEVSEKLAAALKAATQAPLKYVLNTHWHFDHTGGNEMVGKDGAVIVAHANVHKRMSTDQFIGLLDMQVPAAPAAALPAITFGHRIALHLGDEVITAYHVPRAHTDGDAFVHFAQANVLHGGDIFWNGLYPFIDTSSGGGIDGMIKGVKRMLALANDQTRIIPGHGPLATRADLAAYLDMLETTRTRVLALIEEGVGRGEVLFKPVMKDYDETWGKGFMDPERYVMIVYDDLSRK